MRLRAKNGPIYKEIAPIRANQITGITSGFKMDVIIRLNERLARLDICQLASLNLKLISNFQSLIH